MSVQIVFLATTAILVGLTAGASRHVRQVPEQFAQVTNTFKETFGSGGSGGLPALPSSGFPAVPSSGFPTGPSGLSPSKRQIDTSQFSQWTEKFQGMFKPPEAATVSFPSAPTGFVSRFSEAGPAVATSPTH